MAERRHRLGSAPVYPLTAYLLEGRLPTWTSPRTWALIERGGGLLFGASGLGVGGCAAVGRVADVGAWRGG